LADDYFGAALPRSSRHRHSQTWAGGAMSKEQPSSVTFRGPDFVGDDGVTYSDAEITVEMDCDIRSTAKLAQTLEMPLRRNSDV
jgi:hypothetical protein